MTDMFSFDQWLESQYIEYKSKCDYAIQKIDPGGIIGYGIVLGYIKGVQKAWEQSIEYRASLDAIGDNIEDYES